MKIQKTNETLSRWRICVFNRFHRLYLSSLFYSLCLVLMVRKNESPEPSKGQSQRERTKLNGQSQHDRIFVVSLQGTPGVHKSNSRRLDKFSEAWKKSCGFDFDFEHCPGVHDERRGYGPSLSFLFCLERAQQMDVNVSVIFEDDARPFEGSPEVCNEMIRQRMWSHLPLDTFIAFLGGHSWNFTGPSQGDESHQYRDVSSSWGAYAFAVPRSTLHPLIATLKDQIVYGYQKDGVHKHHNYLSPEEAFYDAAKKTNKKIYAVHPLHVWHEGGFSNTWKKDRGSIVGIEEATPDCPLGSTC